MESPNTLGCCFQCSDCPVAFTTLDELQSHEQSAHHNNTLESMKVDVIKMETDDSSDTDSSHISPTFALSLSSPHEVKGRYECEECHEMFAVKRELATHMRIHSGEQPHRCTQCGKEFGTRQLLKKHWMWHTGQRSHVCPHCNKAFFQKGHLTQHLMIHSGGRPHECQQCHKTFIFKFDLNRHMKIHQERGYSCQQCGRSFLKQIMLDEHYLKCKGKMSSPSRSTSSPIKPIPLTTDLAKVAQKIFAQQQEQQQRAALSSLLIKQDQGLNNNIPSIPLICMICKATFNNQSAFAIHTYMHHIASNTASVENQFNIFNAPSSSSISSASSSSSSDHQVQVDAADPGTDTSCASSPQKASPVPLETQVRASSSSISPASQATDGCKECASNWQRIQELEAQINAKNEEFENYRHMIKLVVSTVGGLLNQSAPDNLFVTHASNIFKQLQNSL
ncbi:unnamed protein product [Caenorhabditis bovis]|uniref:C2H2-type domain-containing protein n=1 Tax=Caenorhabditis bovis TaxID=2654633 RepID=A0A8S1FF10_9PELO|nr:unnamed protein product [Caenorhabditis bovis]